MWLRDSETRSVSLAETAGLRYSEADGFFYKHQITEYMNIYIYLYNLSNLIIVPFPVTEQVRGTESSTLLYMVSHLSSLMSHDFIF